MILKRRVQLWRRSEADWGAETDVPDFRWEDPDLVILDKDGKETMRYRISAKDDFIGWKGGSVWVEET